MLKRSGIYIILFILILSLSINFGNAKSGTCINPKGGNYCNNKSQASNCYCDAACKNYRDCCDDYKRTCDVLTKPVSSSQASITASPTIVTIDTPTSVSFTIPYPTTTDWIGVYKSSTAADSAYTDWKYTSSCSKTAGASGSASGTCPFTIPTTGTYKFRSFAKNGYQRLAVSNSVTVIASNAADTTPPAISAVTTTSIKSFGATIIWTTDELSDSQVEYGLTTSYGSSTALDASLVTSHSQTLSGLSASTLYYYRVRSRDGAGNLATSAGFTFTTLSSSPPTPGTNFYVRPNGITYGSGNGADWNNAFSGFAGIAWASVPCGSTVWVAGGTYTQTLSLPGKNCKVGSPLAIRRARSDNTGATGAAGWSASFASLITHRPGAINFGTSDNYVTISGATNAAGGSHGWLLSRSTSTGGSGVNFYGGSSNTVVEWLDLEGAGLITITSDMRAIDLTPNPTAASNNRFSHLKIHDWGEGVTAVVCNSPIFEYIEMSDIWVVNSAMYHPNGIITWACPNGIVRYSSFFRGDNGFMVGEGVFFEQTGGSTNWQIYGNVFYDLNQGGKKAIQITSNVGAIKVFNNVFDDLAVPAVFVNRGACGSGAEVRNNLGYRTSFSSVDGACGTMSNNLVAPSTGVWVNRAARDYHIVSTIRAGFPRDAGVNPASSFTTDKDGVTFGGDGTWDIGAYEHP